MRLADFRAIAILIVPLTLSGCPFSWQKEERTNLPPTTFFPDDPEAAPDIIFRNERSFNWVGSDPDSDVVAYQYQLVEVDDAYFLTGGQVGKVIRYVDPPGRGCPMELNENNELVVVADECWSPRARESFATFVALDDGNYEFRARAIDREGAVDPTPLRKLFIVFFDDVLPEAIIGTIDPNTGVNDCGGGRLGGSQTHTFLINATDRSRNGVTPRSLLEYRVQLRADNQSICQTHIGDPFTEWRRFPDDSDTPIVIGDAPPTQYNDLFPTGCTWTFALEVRDLAGNLGQATCGIEQR